MQLSVLLSESLGIDSKISIVKCDAWRRGLPHLVKTHAIDSALQTVDFIFRVPWRWSWAGLREGSATPRSSNFYRRDELPAPFAKKCYT